MTTAYPLHWPLGMPRTKSPAVSRFTTSISGAVNNVNDELRKFGVDTGRKIESMVISSNVSLGNNKPRDCGIAVYFRWDNMDCCIAVDRYTKPEDNLQAVAKIIEAERTKMRHGGLNIVRASFRGFTALPPPKGPDGHLAAPWRQVLFGDPEKSASLADAEAAYREGVKQHHPDRGGDTGRFNAIADAIRQAREELSP